MLLKMFSHLLEALNQSHQTPHPGNGKRRCGHRICLQQYPGRRKLSKVKNWTNTMVLISVLTNEGQQTSGASTNVCMNFLMGCMLLDSSPITCTTTPSFRVVWASTWRIFVWQSWKLRAITFLWISCTQIFFGFMPIFTFLLVVESQIWHFSIETNKVNIQTGHKQPLLVFRYSPAHHVHRRSSFHKTWAETQKHSLINIQTSVCMFTTHSHH